MNTSSFELQFLGTGAADYDWDSFGKPGVRGSTSSLLNNHILIDCGATGLRNLKRFSVPFSTVDTLLITHSHSDHLNVEQIVELSAARKKPLELYASPESISKIPKTETIITHPLSPGMKFDLGDIAVTALPGNHQTDIPGEITLHYCFETPVGNLLYALDSSWLLKAEILLLKHLHLDWFIMDGTVADDGDYRIFEHTDINMAKHMVKTLRGMQIVTDDTQIYLDHFAKTLWPIAEKDRQQKVAGTGFHLATDGLKISR
ncbi:MAG: MBL fold metallo-hydrolase [Lentisphaeria bacterium]